jgi:hypothetical protein
MDDTLTAEHFRQWLGNFPKQPADQRALALSAIDAYETGERNEALSRGDLAPLIRAASDPHKIVFEVGCHLLAHLATSRVEGQDAFRAMARSKDATARFHAVAYLEESMPEPLRLEIVELALGDRSARVRTKGIERAMDFSFKALLPRLEQMLATEKTNKVKRTLALFVPLLRDGYCLRQSTDGNGYWLTVRKPRSIPTVFIPQAKYSEDFVRSEIARLLAY